MSEHIFYAIGDVHGEHERLRELHELIFEHKQTFGAERPATLVHLGDYVDRGPDSAGAVSYLMEFTEAQGRSGEFTVINLLGNHERMMLDSIDGKDPNALQLWLSNGGQETIDSYSRAAPRGTPLHEAVPLEHIRWMEKLPDIHVDREAGLVFVHAGVKPDEFPGCGEAVRIWTRAHAFMNDSRWPANAALDGMVVVHGHTPTEGEPYVGRRRINLDTGACYGGPLTAGVFMAGEKARFFSA